MLNRCEFIGNLGADPEVRRLQSGAPVVSFRIAVSETWRDKNSGERKEKTEWVSIVIFNEGLCKIAEQYLKKGSKVYIAGQMQTRKWQKDGVDRYTTEVVLKQYRGELEMLGGGNRRGDDDDDDDRGSRQSKGGGGGSRNDDMNDDIPF